MKPESISKQDWNLALKKYSEKELMAKINQNYPIQYLIGDVEFLNTKIKVDERVLIPRFETELLIEKTIKRIKQKNIENPKIIDLGTGSGCIAIALKKNILGEVTSVDISKSALELAFENAKLNNVSIEFICKDMLDIDFYNYDILVSNPPYVAKDEVVGEETKYEPSIALYADNNGMYFYEEIIKKLSTYPNKLKIIAFEIGFLQGEKLKELAKKYLSNYSCTIEKDFTNRDRYAFLEINE